MTDRLLSLLIEFDEMGFLPTTVCEEPEGYAIKWKELLLEEIKALESDNVSLRNEADENAALSMENKMRADRLEVENAALRERLENAVELPYERKRLLWGDKDHETLLCPDCLTDVMGGIGDETFVVQCPNCGCFVNCMVEPIPFTEAEARLAELNGGKK